MKYALANSLSTAVSGLDPDAKAYIAAVEAADGQSLESGVKKAYNSFIKGCKSDSIWDAIKASCILAGARTLSGALVPLKGTAPTNFNFVSGDYNRKTGLIGNGSTKYLNSNRLNNADPQNSKHIAVYQSSLNSGADAVLIGSPNAPGRSAIVHLLASGTSARMNTSAIISQISAVTGFLGGSRSSSTQSQIRNNNATITDSSASQAPSSDSISVFGLIAFGARTNARFQFYSIGESIDLSLLDARITTLVSDISNAIP